MKLTESQVRFFNSFGYLGISKFFTREEVAWVIEGFEWSIQNRGAGRLHDGSKRTMFGGPIEHTPKMCTLLDHPKILGLIGSVIGEDFNYCSGDGNYYTGDTAWHPDGHWGRLWAVKVAFYLDPVTKNTGCLRVIPCSHRPDHFIRKEKINPNQSLELFGVPPKDFPTNVALETEPGDIVMFNHDTYHASFGGNQHRRMFTMNCTRHAQTPEELEFARKYVSIHSPGGYNVSTGAGMYFPTMVDTADEKRMEHLRQPIDLHDELFPHLSRKNADRLKYVRHEISPLLPPIGSIREAALPPESVRFQEALPDVLARSLIDIRKTHQGQDGVVYVRTTFKLLEPGPLAFSYGADAPLKAWLNGEEVDCRLDAAPPAKPSQFLVKAKGQEGANTAVFVISTNGGKACGVIPSFVAGQR